jgi:hypothetical protein
MQAASWRAREPSMSAVTFTGSEISYHVPQARGWLEWTNIHLALCKNRVRMSIFRLNHRAGNSGAGCQNIERATQSAGGESQESAGTAPR